MKTRFMIIGLGLLFLTGAGMIVYPYIQYAIAKNEQGKVIYQYTETTNQMEEAEKDRLLNQARIYNARLANPTLTVEDVEDANVTYTDCLDLGDGLMGSLEISVIDVNLPIYHGDSEVVLSKGCGHFEQSSLPVGGGSTHAVLSSHTGYAKAKLFTDLDKLVIGDRFYLHVLDQTFCYQIDQINVVLPNDFSHLAIEEGKDYVTLLTCTPYGINSHRLLVRGTRIEETMTNNQIIPHRKSTQEIAFKTGGSLITLVLLSIGLWQIKKNKRRKQI